ncbi:hypothetical protein NQ020_10995 [Corynebacterium sp. 1222RC1]|uniref:hypothetical protein n=1 Tax=Corynebacterium sp. 1222RC1 TaxID=2968464 RepID=UPI00211BC6F9|nr:hypothetical protein [Corynebacterium sp. 1222RC1]MCQ9355766.1 hypothetical protein [Corynebacterium sp. 1222RC1]
MSDQKGYAAFNVRHLRRIDCGGSTRGDRSRILNECMRKLDAKNLKFQAQRNPNIVVQDSHLNVPFVNDGTGKMRRAKSVDDVLAYQDSRMDGVRVLKKSYETSMFVIHLPKSMCIEIPDYYTSVVDGEEVKRPRMVARDYNEAKKYLQQAMYWVADNVLPGGRLALAGGDMNFDESTPHIQFHADTFSPDPKRPGKLRCAPGIAYNTHPEVRYQDGPKKGQQIAGQIKMSLAQQGLREHMHSLGYPVELGVSERHDESLNLDRFQRLEDQERLLEQREKRVAEAETILQEDREFATRQGYGDGHHQGRKEGFDQGLADTQADRDAAAADRQAAAEELRRARETVQRQVESARRKAREQAEEDAKAIKAAAEAEASQKLVEVQKKLAEANNTLAKAAQELEEAELEKSAAASDRAAAATELGKAKDAREQAGRDQEAAHADRQAAAQDRTAAKQYRDKAAQELSEARARANDEVKAIRDAAAADRAKAAQELAGVQDRAARIIDAANTVAQTALDKVIKQAKTLGKQAREHMMIVDSDFLDALLQRPEIRAEYDLHVKQAFDNPGPDPR